MSVPVWIFPLGVVLLLPFFFIAAVAHDRLVRRLYELHREAWTRAGSPRGFFWKPSEPLPLSSFPAFLKSSMTWAFRLPGPLAKDPSAQRSLRMLRLGLIVWNVGGIALFTTLVLTHGPGTL